MADVSFSLPAHVILGDPRHVDPDVLLGYLTGRRNVALELRIAPGAHLRSGTVIYQGTTIGERLETGHNVVIREENRIGDRFAVWNNTVIDYGCVIGDDVKIHANCYVAQFTEIGDGAFLAPGVTIANDPHPGCPQSGECMKGPIIEAGAQIGVNVTIVPMVRIGARALIGSGAVVTRDIPPATVAYGNPARVHGSIYDIDCVVDLRQRPYEPPA